MKIPKSIEDLTSPPIVGEYYLVPCIERRRGKITDIIIIINHPHNDVENGQPEIHYHADDRFRICDKNGDIIKKYDFISNLRIEKLEKEEVFYMIAYCISDKNYTKTPKEFISQSKLKHKCIHKGRCPHRGYDLSSTPIVNGIITCPLHSLKFNAETKQLIE